MTDQPTLFDLHAPASDLPDGAHHRSAWLDSAQQRWILAQYAAWAKGPVPPNSPVIHGHPMSVSMLCLGWHWTPGRYTRRAVDVNNAPVLPVPDWLVELGRRAVAETTGDAALAASYTPDVALVNHYLDAAKMGMHRDADERSDAPVVSLSIGDTCRFRFGNAETRNRPYTDLWLASGDLFVFGGPARQNYHGVTKVYPNTAPYELEIHGRLNITLRQTGLRG
ncbi:alpha-ketoglutarate-dependent dioxygenase AlkB family protein [Corynebacterium glyciniphilum]|uniref:alpha-ketoglutarate-dependent dioxygenase AlkB family protein n=1 Tax=Corynebacterium glyciniphilum TaxID=1404244 RepID=UPI0011AB5AE1|nr:alpha-ketoglutarate-dependent dioxygenase AlkB [Corynebacterium glyciniphilum]